MIFLKIVHAFFPPFLRLLFSISLEQRYQTYSLQAESGLQSTSTQLTWLPAGHWKLGVVPRGMACCRTWGLSGHDYLWQEHKWGQRPQSLSNCFAHLHRTAQPSQLLAHAVCTVCPVPEPELPPLHRACDDSDSSSSGIGHVAGARAALPQDVTTAATCPGLEPELLLLLLPPLHALGWNHHRPGPAWGAWWV